MRHSVDRAASAEKPMAHRCSVATLLVLLAPSPLAAQRSFTEAEVVELALARMPIDERALADADAARALGIIDGAWSSPEIGYTREEMPGMGGTGEDYAYAAWRVDLSGRIFLRRDAADRRAHAVASASEASRAALAASVRTRFFRALAARMRAAVLSRWCERVGGALDIVARRADAGDAAAYDALRLRRELRLATARRDEALVDATALEAALAALVGEDGPLALVGELLLVDDGPIDTLLAEVTEAPALRSLRELDEAAGLDAEGSRRSWVPELLLGAGYKGVTTYGTDNFRSDGFTLTIGITLPIFDTASGRLMHDEALGRSLEATLDIETTRARSEAAEAATRARELAALATRFEGERLADADVLVTGATRAYGGGELSVLELLDAHRGVTEDALFFVELALEARLARIELERLAGRTN